MKDQADENELEDDIPPEISLHAITGIKNSQTMQLQILVNRHPMLGLVDSGSTHNFISESTAIRFGLKVAQRNGFQVAVANGEK